jgi:DNA-binding LacI/PurR family transcriptional regulator
LARGSTGAVGVLLTSSLRYAFTDDVAMGFLGAATEQLNPTGLALTLLPSTSGEGVVAARDVALDGALVYSCDPDTTAMDWLERRGLPLVYVDQDPREGFAAVNVADREGARAAAQHLVDLGHRRVAVMTAGLGGAPGLVAGDVLAEASSWKHVSRERMLGYLDVLGPLGAELLVHRQVDNDDEQARVAARELLARDDRPTGVLCYSDVLAHGVVRAAEDLGLEVPRDLSVVGFDDSPLASRVRPALTTVRQQVAEKGRIAAAALNAAIDATRTGGRPLAEHVVLPTELVVRDSTAPA